MIVQRTTVTGIRDIEVEIAEMLSRSRSHRTHLVCVCRSVATDVAIRLLRPFTAASFTPARPMTTIGLGIPSTAGTTQCAAVSTTRGWIREPVHRYFPLSGRMMMAAKRYLRLHASKMKGLGLELPQMGAIHERIWCSCDLVQTCSCACSMIHMCAAAHCASLPVA